MGEHFYYWVEILSLIIEGLAVTLIVFGVFVSTIRFFVSRYRESAPYERRYTDYRHALARSLMLGLEILVAADVVRTIALEPTFENVAVLGILVMIRIALGWSLVVEIEGRWPWQTSSTKENN